jgi:hypothetical protein
MARKHPPDYKNAIQSSGFDIYDPIKVGDASLWIPTPQLEALLNQALTGLDLNGFALRTRSKVVKTAVCEALGYPTPKSFKKTKPRFPGQQLDTYTQKRSNLQIWNEELSPNRRYAVVQISDDGFVLKIKVVNGQELTRLDKTGKITKKYQAGFIAGTNFLELVSAQDTPAILPCLQSGATFSASISPIDEPECDALLPIRDVFERLSHLIGFSFADPGVDQERHRGAALHRLVCERLGYSSYEDNGQFPDIRHQLLEVKLQTSPTIDLGLVLPSSEEHCDVRQLRGYHPRHCDTRYAIFFANTDGNLVTLTHLIVTTGADFFQQFRRFEGKVTNGKIQIPLPQNFFSG